MPHNPLLLQRTRARQDDIVAGGGDALVLILQLAQVLPYRVSAAAVPAEQYGTSAGTHKE